MNESDAITSSTNTKFRLLKALWTAKGIGKHSACLVGGAKLVTERLVERPADVMAIVAMQGETLDRDLDDLVARARCPVWTLAPALFREIDESMTRRPLAVVRAPEIQAGTAEAFPSAACLVLPLQSPENLGAAVRSALAFGIDEIVLTAESANPFLPRAIRSSAGAVFRARFRRAPKLAELAPPSARALVLDGGGEALAKDVGTRHRDAIWIVGVEGGGVPEALKGLTHVAIPMTNAVESLNATVALSIALFQWSVGRS